MSRYHRIKYYHKQMIAAFGQESSRAQGWREPADQVKRFEILATIGDFNHKTVLDAGCGYADLYPYLRHRYPHLSHYTGIEQLNDFARIAALRYPDATILNSDFTDNIPSADYILACGCLNYSSRQKHFLYKTIRKLYGSASIALGINLLRYTTTGGILSAYDPQTVLQFARSICSNVHLIDNYDPEDYTIFMYK